MPSGNNSATRARFAPSPTGYLHVGGARTALFNWLFARSTGGAFILRVEDTDAERNRPELVEGILDGLKWLGLDWDEGPIFQSSRTALYAAAVEKLLASGAAYYCNCPPEKYSGGDAAEPGDAAEKSAPRRVVRCQCRERAVVSAGDVVPGREAPAVRFRVPLAQNTQFDDAVFGPREISNDEIEDFVLLRSPRDGQQHGLPTYQLCAVVDDVDMRITHVIRGADHLSNTPKQVLLYRALGAAVPIFAHVPLILGPDRTRLSKRHGATSVGSYRDEGFLAEAFANFLALLGWSPGDDSEFLRTPELLRRFSLAGVSRTNAVFDRPKLEWFNQQYLQKLPIEELLPIVEAELRAAAIWRDEWAAGAGREWFARTVDLLRPRTRPAAGFAHALDRDRRAQSRPRLIAGSLLHGRTENSAQDAFADRPVRGDHLQPRRSQCRRGRKRSRALPPHHRGARLRYERRGERGRQRGRPGYPQSARRSHRRPSGQGPARAARSVVVRRRTASWGTPACKPSPRRARQPYRL